MCDEMIDSCGINYLRVIKILNNCPKCQNPYVGKGYGTLMIDRYHIIRICHCGYVFKYDMRKGKTTKDIEAAVKKSIRRKVKNK